MQLSSAVVSNRLRRRAALGAALSLVVSLTPAGPAAGQTTASCRDTTEETPEQYGPTDISAVSGNQKMAAGFNPDGTITVLRWPSPSYFDQIKYRTTDRAARRFGALPNEGAFFGLGYKKGTKPWRFDWLREWRSGQRFADEDGDEVVTRYRKRSQGLTVTVRDVVAAGSDTLVRSVSVTRSRSSNVSRARVIAFANFNPVFSKTPRDPTDDWCTEEDNDDGAAYDAEADAIVHSRTGVDSSTGEPSGAALAMGFDAASDDHHVGTDSYETGSGDPSAYDDARDARLAGGDSVIGHADATIADDLSLKKRRSGSSTLYISAAFSPDEAISGLRSVRRNGASALRAAKRRWWQNWLEGTKLPRNAPGAITTLAKRSLISARQAADPRGLVVTSIATQSPMAQDWIRHGAYINRMLEISGKGDMVERHNRRYAQLQATAVAKPVGGETTPSGNWAQNYYADGVVGGPITYEIDETGLGIWTLWDHFSYSKDRPYLLAVYEAIQRAAHYLTDNAPLGCRDPATGLQCSASEEDDPSPSRTLVGAQAVWRGLDAAVKAAKALDTETSNANAITWATRRDEIKAALKDAYFDQECGCYTRDYETGGTTLWPVELEPYGSKISDAQAEANWRHLARVLSGKEHRGRLESRALVGNAYAWAGQPAKLKRVKRALRWVASVPTTNSTGLLGEAWMSYPRESSPVVTMVSQPHVWNHAMFYLAALRAYGSERWSR